MRVIIAGGGTGGHLFPALALAQELKRERPETEVLLVGTSAGMEAKWFPRSGFNYELLSVHGVRGHSAGERIVAMFEVVGAAIKARSMLKRFGPDLVVSVGGYASAPMGVAALTTGTPLVLLEQNVKPGLTNRMLWRFAKKICVSFIETASYFRSTKVVVTGNPSRFKMDPELSESTREFQILVLGGSSGAHRLNIGALDAFEILAKDVISLAVVHQTGEADERLVRDAYLKLGLKAEVIPFIEDLSSALKRAQIVIARAGGVTVSEMALAGRPAVFVPYPFHRDQQQQLNARVLEQAGAAVIIPDDEKLGKNLAAVLGRLAVDRKGLAEMGVRARQVAMPDAGARIARVCFEVVAQGALS